MRRRGPTSVLRLGTLLLGASVLGSAGAATKHYSFSNGYPTTTTRQPSQATLSSSGPVTASRTGSKKSDVKTLVGTVTRVDAGDLICVTPTGGRATKVRLECADAPEQGQPYGVEAKKFLFDLVNGKSVTVNYSGRDRSGAVLGTVYLSHEKGLVDVNLTLIKNGCAWYVEAARRTDGTSDQGRARAYAAALEDARSSKRGLWSALNPVSPAEWRKLRR